MKYLFKFRCAKWIGVKIRYFLILIHQNIYGLKWIWVQLNKTIKQLNLWQNIEDGERSHVTHAAWIYQFICFEFAEFLVLLKKHDFTSLLVLNVQRGIIYYFTICGKMQPKMTLIPSEAFTAAWT